MLSRDACESGGRVELGCVDGAQMTCRHCLNMKRDRVIERLEWMIVIILSLEAGISFLKWIWQVPH